jgi:hypothetical protein
MGLHPKLGLPAVTGFTRYLRPALISVKTESAETARSFALEKASSSETIGHQKF